MSDLSLLELFYCWACAARKIEMSPKTAEIRDDTIKILKAIIDGQQCQSGALVAWNRYTDAYDAEKGEDAHFNNISQCI